MEAQRYPEDYDGIWSAEPAINWSRFVPAAIWPVLVMKEYANPRTGEARSLPAGGDRGRARGGRRDPVRHHIRPARLGSARTGGHLDGGGVITATDATVMGKIWEGPRSPDGGFRWFGLRPGTESWGVPAPRRGWR